MGFLQILQDDNDFSREIKQVLAQLSGFLGYKDGSYQFPDTAQHDIDESKKKAERKLDDTGAVSTYQDAIDHSRKQIQVTYAGDKTPTALHEVKRVDDPATGFRGAIYMDDKGHSVVYYAGMDKESNAGNRQKDEETLVQASLKGQVNEKTGLAQQLYLDAVHMSKSTEIVGYSLGSMLGNDMAARFGAKSTNIADIGLPDLRGPDGKPLYTEEQKKQVSQNVTSLHVQGDTMYASAGHVYGHEQNLNPVATDKILARTSKDPSYSDAFNAASDPGRLLHSITSYLSSLTTTTPSQNAPVVTANMAPPQQRQGPG